ncbi:hypothetical protein FACS189449_13090 [Alphaproteobacteria bacterium]|nr:hypothetical protein FACS189449_13090 [Alphaproteobacteria bacterium]
MTDKSNKQEKNELIMNDILSKIKGAWDSPIVLRKDIAKFSFGLVTVRTMQTLDSRGDGIKNSITINGKVAYTLDAAIEWLESRIKKQEIKKERRVHKNDILLNTS